MKTRCKVWVNFIPGDDGGEAFNKKGTAIDSAGWQALKVAVPFIEYLPGDVVLSRESETRIRSVLKALEEAPVKRGSVVAVLIKNSTSEIRALLRGRR